MQYAELVVMTPIRRRMVTIEDASSDTAEGYDPLGPTFHYAIPPALRGRVAVGQMVWATLRTRPVQGIVVGLSDTSPVEDTKELAGLVWPDPVLSPEQIELARWIGRTYLSPLLYTLRLMLPPGLEQRAELVAELVPDVVLPPNLTPAQRQVVAMLARRGGAPVSEVGQKLRGGARVVDQLIERGVVAKRYRFEPPRVGPKIGRMVRLVADDEAVEQAIPQLGIASKQADALAVLAESDDPLPTLADVCRRAGCGPGPVRALAKRGWVEITERRELIAPLLSPQAIDEAIATDLRRAPRQAAVLAALRDRAAPVPATELYRETGTSSGVLRALEARGYVQRITEQPAVLLRLSGDEVEEAIIELRHARKQVEVLDFLQAEGEPVWIGWVYAQTEATLDTLRALEAHGLIRIEEEEVWRDPLAGREFAPAEPPRLTPDQERVWREIEAGIREGRHRAYLLHGVTGSGKTEIYLQALAEVVRQGRQAIVLVPEIALTPQTIRRFAARFPDRVAVWHSQLSLGERYDTWRRVRAGERDVVIGSRSAIFAPLPRLGLIVVDEEHEPSYKQERAPRYHARDVAVERARLAGATVILGTATPDVVSYHRAQRGEYRLLELPQRIMGYRGLAAGTGVSLTSPLPAVHVVDMRQELRAGNRSMFSRALQRALRDTLAASEQAILFLNRRGTATFVMCRDCGLVLRCPRCDVPLTYHSAGDDLVCHHCHRRQPTPDTCPHCWSGRIKFFGAGTQRVEAEVQKLFPQARLLRWDRDVTRTKGAHDLILDRFIAHQADVLIGTQMIAKGLDMPLVTLVGVVSADTALYLPDFRAGERTFQLLTQVAGRAGRSARGGRVIVQTYTPEHYCIRAASGHDYATFYRQEIAHRRELLLPPFRRLVRLVYVHASRQRCEEQTGRLAEVLRHKIARLGLPGVELIGPAPCFLGRLRGQHRWQIVVRAPDPHALLADQPLPLGWRVDVDPVSLL